MQVDGYSLEAQKERLRSEAKHRGMKVVGEYSDEGKSGKNITGRPEFKRMLSDIKTGKDDVQVVLVFKLSCFGRNTSDTLNALQYLEDYGVSLICVEDGIDSSGPAGKLMISQIWKCITKVWLKLCRLVWVQRMIPSPCLSTQVLSLQQMII